MTERHVRTLARSISYRVLAFILSGFIVGWSTAFGLHVLLTILHYLHERVWLQISWGRE